MTEDFDRQLHESPEYRQEQFSAALDGMLSADEQAALDAHLAGCEACTRELEELRQVRMLLRAMPEPALPRSFLLPTEGELVAPTVPAVPARPVERQPAANVTPLRQPSRRDSRSTRATRTLRVTRWVGAIAAVLGLALFLGTLLPGLSHQGGAYSASAPVAAQNGSSKTVDAARTATQETNPSPTNNIADGGHNQSATVTAHAAAPTQITATPTGTLAYESPGPSLGEILRVVALVLLLGGIALALVSLIVTRRV